MRPHFILPLALALGACQPPKQAKSQAKSQAESQNAPAPALAMSAMAAQAPAEAPAPAPAVTASVVRINSTQQSWQSWQPWEKNPPAGRRALAAIVAPQQVLTTAELVAQSTYLEFESPNGDRFAQAKVLAVDYEANLALLGPADETEGKTFFAGTVPFKLASPSQLGTTLDIVQVEDNGIALQTAGSLQSIDFTPSFLPGNSFLTYLVKASMQSAASSYSLPVLRNGQLSGVLTSYDAKDQLCDVVPTDIVARFLKQAATGHYTGFPSFGATIASTEDASFRQWLKLGDEQGGLYIQKVRKGGAADLAGVKSGDVLLAIDGQAIDRHGYYEHPLYGKLLWGHLVRGEKSVGDTVNLSLLRAGQTLDIKATLAREEEQTRLVPTHQFDGPPNFLVKGGLVFQELSLPLLQAFGEDWQTRAPLNLLDAYQNPEKFEQSANRVVFLSGIIPTPATVGYERLSNLIVRQVNGKQVKDIKSLIAAFDEHEGPLHAVEFADEKITVYLDDAVCTTVDSQLLQRGLSRLSRTH